MLSISCHSSEVLRFKAQVRLDTSGPKHLAASSRIFALQRWNAVYVSPVALVLRPSVAVHRGLRFSRVRKSGIQKEALTSEPLFKRDGIGQLLAAQRHRTRATFSVQSFLASNNGHPGTWALSCWMQAMQSRGLLLSGRCQYAGVARIAPFAAPRLDRRLCTPSLRSSSTRRDVAQCVAVTEAPTEQPKQQLQG